MGVFRFKRFEVRNERSAMKVNTDGVLLGAAVTLSGSEKRVLDVGTGTGTIALMLAQRLSDMGADARITGIDIDAPSAEEAGENFAASPWAAALDARHVPMQQYDGGPFDLIVSNPPYFDDSLQAPDARRNISRHSLEGASLSYRELVAFAAERLGPDGRLAVILPADVEKTLRRTAVSFGLYPSRMLRVRTKATKAPSRIIVEFGREIVAPVEELLTIHEKERYSEEYLSMTDTFYIH